MMELLEAPRRHAGVTALVLWALLPAGGCASGPAGAGFPRQASLSIAHPEDTALGRQFAGEAQQHPGASGFHLINIGADGFRARMEMIEVARQSLDLQYYIFRGMRPGDS